MGAGERFQRICGYASLAEMRKGIEVRLGPGDRERLESRDRLGEQPAEAYVAGSDCAAERRCDRPSSAPLARPQPDRAGLLKAQDPAAPNRPPLSSLKRRARTARAQR